VQSLFRNQLFFFEICITQRANMETLLKHPWLIGSVGPIARCPIEQTITLDPVVLGHVVSLGIPEEMVKNSVQQGQRDQISTCYHLATQQLGRSRSVDAISSMNVSGEFDLSQTPSNSPGRSPPADSKLDGCLVM
jgi:hypothetical protein